MLGFVPYRSLPNDVQQALAEPEIRRDLRDATLDLLGEAGFYSPWAFPIMYGYTVRPR